MALSIGILHVNVLSRRLSVKERCERASFSRTRNVYSGPSLDSSRRWRHVYSGVAEVVGRDDPSAAMDVDTGSQDFEYNPLRKPREGFKADLFRNQTEELRQEILSADFEVKPTPYSPVDGIEAVQFYVICLLLFVAFWVGNYYAPNLIFKDTVFRNGSGEDDDEKDSFAGGSEQLVEVQHREGPAPVQSVDSLTGNMKELDDRTEKIVLGFGKSSEQRPKKPRRPL